MRQSNQVRDKSDRKLLPKVIERVEKGTLDYDNFASDGMEEFDEGVVRTKLATRIFCEETIAATNKNGVGSTVMFIVVLIGIAMYLFRGTFL